MVEYQSGEFSVVDEICGFPIVRNKFLKGFATGVLKDGKHYFASLSQVDLYKAECMIFPIVGDEIDYSDAVFVNYYYAASVDNLKESVRIFLKKNTERINGG